MVDVSTNTKNRVTVSVPASNSVTGNTNASAQLARSWAVGEGLIENEDYSSKHYAQEAKEAAENLDEYTQRAEEAAEQAEESAQSASTSADTAQLYAEQAIIGMQWIKCETSDWVEVDDSYTFTINKPMGISGVYKGAWATKELVEDVGVQITETSVVVTSSEQFNGYVLGATAVLTDEQDLSDIYDKHYTHTQAIASDTWVINHNLNKYPSVKVIDSAGNLQIPEAEVQDSANRITLTFLAAFAGQAYLN